MLGKATRSLTGGSYLHVLFPGHLLIFALYPPVRTMTVFQVFVCSGGDSGYMKRLADTELPLPLCLRWVDAGTDALNRTRFVLQENDTGEIMVSLTQCNIFMFYT